MKIRVPPGGAPTRSVGQARDFHEKLALQLELLELAPELGALVYAPTLSAQPVVHVGRVAYFRITIGDRRSPPATPGPDQLNHPPQRATTMYLWQVVTTPDNLLERASD